MYHAFMGLRPSRRPGHPVATREDQERAQRPNAIAPGIGMTANDTFPTPRADDSHFDVAGQAGKSPLGVDRLRHFRIVDRVVQ